MSVKRIPIEDTAGETRRASRVRKKRVSVALLAYSALAAISYAPALHAQEAEDAERDATSQNLIVVTATKREALIQNVPVSVRALTGDELDRIGAVDMESYIKTVPGVSLNENGPGQNGVIIRGLSAVSGFASPVGYYIDDVSQAQNQQSDLELYDIESVQILRGPQGTLFGEGSIGGTILIRTNQPVLDEFQGSADLEVSSLTSGGEGFATHAMINLPIVKDRLGIRLTGYHRDDSGWIDNIVTGSKNVNTLERTGFRGLLLFKPTDRLNLTLSGYYQEMTTGALQTQDPLFAGGRFEAASPEDGVSRQDIEQYSARLTYDLDFAELTSVTAYYKRDQQIDEVISDFVGSGGFLNNGDFIRRLNDEPTRLFNHETRLVSSGDNTLDWLVGIYYSERKQSFDQSFIDIGNPTFFGGIQFLGERDINQVGVFGEANYALADNFDFTAGLRYYREEYTYDGAEVFPGLPANPLLPPKGKDKAWSPKFALSYFPTDDLSVYGLVTRGFRAGGHTGNTPGLAPDTFGPDSNWNYEIGVKGVFFGGDLVANFAAYYINWTDLQVSDQFFNPDLQADINYTSNAGSADSKGFELDIFATPFDGLSINMGLGYIDAKLTKDVPTLGGVAGDRLGDVPDLTVSVDAQYEFPIGNTLEGFVGGSFQHIGEAQDNFTAVIQDGNRTLDSYNLGGLRAGVRNDNWEFRVFADNVWNEFSVTSYLLIQEVTLRPRRIGARVSVSF
ncbi:TonB-dependent receptor [Pacificimonas sp. WHA3]|uniref:TonB-dependent receptor n=1 Tax=Pacificimonas pallii TaxID=2827236 RepID=A0ABS6SAA3_9SPHN|nr:TonB-dependent receptor [Pacificimonas pallii]MBV7255307.1 TonB-dependent receptor [Pacificimonas pallii]